MVRAMQAILIAGEEARDQVISGQKLVTIRNGHRDYSIGPVMIGCPELNWCVVRNITSVENITLGAVSKQDMYDDGFNSISDAIDRLSVFYPGIDRSSDVTVIRWE